MNISTIAFKGNNYNKYDEGPEVPPFVNRPQPSRTVSETRFERTPGTDRFEQNNTRKSSSAGKTSRKKKKPTPLGTMVKSFAAGVAATLLVNAGAAQLSKPADKIVVPFDNSVSITEMAEIYDADVNAILDYNNITEETDLD